MKKISLVEKFEGAIEDSFTSFEQALKEQLYSLTPVDTGFLRDGEVGQTGSNQGTRIERDGNVVRIYNNAPYAGYVHDGTSKMQARPFIKEALERVNFKKSLEEGIRNANL